MHRVLVIVGVPLWEDCHADCGWKQAVMAMGTGGVLRGSASSMGAGYCGVAG